MTNDQDVSKEYVHCGDCRGDGGIPLPHLSVPAAFSAKTHPENITAQVAHGKEVWEKHACINCHTLLGEGAYYAPELGNAIARRGEPFVRTVLETTAAQGWGTTRKMPQFDLSEGDIDALIEFFKWMNNVDTNNWPPNKEG